MKEKWVNRQGSKCTSNQYSKLFLITVNFKPPYGIGGIVRAVRDP